MSKDWHLAYNFDVKRVANYEDKKLLIKLFINQNYHYEKIYFYAGATIVRWHELG